MLIMLSFLSIAISLISASQAHGEMSIADLSDLRSWRGLEADQAMRYKGLPAPVWRHAGSAAIRTEAIPHDWSAYNAIRFAMYSKKATGAGFMLILPSEDSTASGDDYFSFPITLDWAGWKEFVIPFNEFVRSRRPVGFGKIDAIALTAEGWGNHPNPDSVVNLADLRLTNIESPGISDDDLFKLLNLDYPGLEKVRAAVSSGDLAAARHELAEHLRHREKPRWKWDWRARPEHKSRPDGVDTTEADRALQRELLSVDVYHKFEDRID